MHKDRDAPAETRIRIEAVIAEKRLALSVTDDGPGIAPELLPHVFEKFVRARSTEAGSTDGGEGTGLGLAIAKGIMDAHGGAIAAQSRIANGHGTRIVLTFPRAEEPR